MHIKKYTEKDRYGNTFSYEFDVPSLQEIPQPEPSIFKPKGTDTVPAMLTPGENVVNAEASRLPGVQPMLDELNDVGRAIQKKQGGPIPSYKQEGGFVIDDAMLDAIRQVESGGDPSLISNKGAAGPYQIMLSTALKPGYNTTPISSKDRFDPTISRQFAKQYLEGIKKRHPEFTRDEVLTAYHSGVGNVLKAKSGEEELGPYGKEYANKVDMAMIPKPMARPAVFDDTPIESGIISAEASTNNNEIPEPSIDRDMYSGMSKKDIQRLEAGVDDDIILDSDGSVQSVNPNRVDPSIPKKLSEKFIKDGNKKAYDFYLNDYKKALKQDKAHKEFMKNKELKIKSEETAKKTKKINDEIKKVESIISIAKETNDKNLLKNAEKRKEELTNQLNNQGKNVTPPPPTGIKEVISDIVESTKNNPKVTDDEKKTIIEGKKKKDEDPTLYEEVKTELSKFFDVGELVRATLVYLGSRALGYNHGSSINFTGKNYLKRIDAQMAAVEKYANSKEAMEKFTQSSLKDFVDSGGDRDKLVPIQKSKQISEILDPLFDEKTNAIVETYRLNDKDKTVVVNFPDIGMTPIGDAEAIKRVAKVNENIHNPNKIKENIFKAAKEFATARNTATGADADDKEFINPTFTRQLSEKGYSILSRALKQASNRDSDARARLIGEINFAMGDMFDAIAKGDETITPDSLEKYLNARVAVLETLGAVSYNDIAGFEKGFEKVRKAVARQAGNFKVPKGMKRDVVQTKVYKGLWMTFKQVFEDYKALYEADKLDGLSSVFINADQEEAGYNDFLNFIDQALIRKNPEALAIIAKLRKEI